METRVTTCGGEDGKEYLIVDGALVADYWDNQSPVAETFCSAPSPGLQDASIDCLGAFFELAGKSHLGGAFDQTAALSSDAIKDIEGDAAQELAAFVASDLLGPGESITYETSTHEIWGGVIVEALASIGNQQQIHYIAAGDVGSLELVATRDSMGTSAVRCEPIP